MQKTTIAVLIIILLSFVIGIYIYPQMPDKMASHWNAKGEVDGYMPKFFGLFLMPIISVVLVLLFILIPKIDPLKHNIQKFRKHFNMFILLIFLFLFYLYLLTILLNKGIKLDIIKFIIPAFGILFYYIGILCENAKRNWFIGIRTPWTLSNDIVWDKTHKLGGKLFKIAGVIALFGILFKKYAFLLVIVPIIIVIIYTIVYSYLEYSKRIVKDKKQVKR